MLAHSVEQKEEGKQNMNREEIKNELMDCLEYLEDESLIVLLELIKTYPSVKNRDSNRKRTEI